MDAARELLALAERRGPTLGSGHLICIDGPAGSGKTTLAATLAGMAPGAVVVHTDDLLAGWHGLPDLAATVHELLAPLAADLPGAWTRWDWRTSGWAERHEVSPGGLLVVEGVGSWSPGIADWVGALAWVEAAYDVRMARGLARDGDDFAPYWEQWSRDEAALFARDGTRDHADLVIGT